MDPTTMDADSPTDLAVGSDKVLLRPHRPTDAVEAFELLHDNLVASKTYVLEPGMAVAYKVGDLHAPKRDGETRLIRLEGQNLDRVKRDKYELV